MNKKEKAAMRALEVRCALRWTEAARPDIPVPESYNDLSEGWRVIASRGAVHGVERSWSKGSVHGHGISAAGFGSQGGIAQYSTKVLALRALRAELERAFAEQLFLVDQRLTEEEQS